MTTTILAVTSLVLLVMLILNKRAVKNIYSGASAQVGELGRWVKNADPLAIYKEAVDNGLENIEKSRKTLESIQGQVRSLKRQVQEGEQEQKRLTNRIEIALSKGDPNQTVKEYALQLESVERNLESNKSQLTRSEEMYNNFVKQIESNQKKVLDARREAKDLGLQLEESEREKELKTFATNFAKSSAFEFSDSLAEAKESIRQKIDQNRAVGDVALDLSRQGVAEASDEELERDQRAEDILARFKK